MASRVVKVDRAGIQKATGPLAIRALAKGLAVTNRHFFRNLFGWLRGKPTVATVMFPEEDVKKPPAFRGMPVLVQMENGKERCVACGLCPQICPANCIKLVPGEDEEGNRYPLIYEIDEFRCIFCGYCQEVCPEEAIHVGVHYENSEYSRDRFVYDLERLSAQTHPVSTLWDPSDPKGE